MKLKLGDTVIFRRDHGPDTTSGTRAVVVKLSPGEFMGDVVRIDVSTANGRVIQDVPAMHVAVKG